MMRNQSNDATRRMIQAIALKQQDANLREVESTLPVRLRKRLAPEERANVAKYGRCFEALKKAANRQRPFNGPGSLRVRYFALLNPIWGTVENDSVGIFKEVEEKNGLSLQRLTPEGDWVIDSELAKYLYQGEPGAEETDVQTAEKLIAVFIPRSSSLHRA